MSAQAPVGSDKTPKVVNGGYELVPVSDLAEHPQNPRRGDISAIEGSIEANGFYGAVVAQKSSRLILAGNHRWKAARAQGLPDIPVIWADVDDDTALRILLADNRTNDLAGYDEPILLELLQAAQAAENLVGTGYSDSDIDALLAESRKALGRAMDDDHEPPEHMDDVIAEQCVLGDIWTIGGQTIVCGDSTDRDVYAKLLGNTRADLVFTSPPYNVGVGYDEHVDKPDWTSYESLLRAVIGNVVERMASGRALCWNIPQSAPARYWRQASMIEDAGLDYLRTMIWHKKITTFPQWDNIDTQRVRGFRSDAMFEFVMIFASGKLEVGTQTTLDDTIAKDVFYVSPTTSTRDIPAGDTPTGRAGSGSIGRARPKKAHPATFPVQVPTPFVNNFTAPGEAVLDPFCGAGTTLIAAHRLARRGFGVELSPRYVDLALWRLQTEMGELPMRNGTAYNFKKAEQ